MTPSLKRLIIWTLITLGTYVFLYAPIAAVVFQSFNSNRYGGPWQGFTTEWYVRLLNPEATGDTGASLSTEQKYDALKNSLHLAVVSASVATILGTMLAWAQRLRRRPTIGNRMIDTLLYVPLTVPDIVLAVSLLIVFGVAGTVLGQILGDDVGSHPLLGMHAMVAGHVTLQLPFVVLAVRARLSDVDKSLEEAARDLGAGAWSVFARVTLPLMMPGIVAAWLLAFTLSLDDFVISFFTGGPGTTTLPILIYSSVRRGISQEINALSSLVVACSLLTTLMIGLLQFHYFNFKKESR